MRHSYKQFFIMCPSFHGSTILCLLLNNHSQIRAIGDSNPNGQQNNACICGHTFQDCPFWTQMRKSVGYKDSDIFIYHQMPKFLPDKGLNAKLIHALNNISFLTGPKLWKALGGAPETFSDRYSKYLKAAYDWEPFDLFVNAQKNILTLSTLVTMGEPVEGVVHLIRDPRAYVVSAMKAHKSKDYATFARKWLKEHRMIEYYLNFLKIKRLDLRYEDFTQSPEANMDHLLAFMGMSSEDVFYPPKHDKKYHMYGNQSVHQFDGKVYAQEKWGESLPKEVQKQILELTSPLSAQYGYRLDETA